MYEAAYTFQTFSLSTGINVPNQQWKLQSV